MAATVQGMNDPDTIKGIADDANAIADQLKDAAAKIAKAAAEMKKKPDECKKSAETLMGLLQGVSKSSKDMDDLSKKIGKSVAK